MKTKFSMVTDVAARTRPRPYVKLKEQIIADIRNRTLKGGDRIPSIRRLATGAGVSPATAQRAIRELVAEGYLVAEDRRGVFVADHDNDAAGITVGLLLTQPLDCDPAYRGYLWPAIEVLQEAFLATGISMLTVPCSRRDAHGDMQVALSRSQLANWDTRALILLGIKDLCFIGSLTDLPMPIISVDIDGSDLGAHSVLFDNMGAANELTRALIGRGHEKILFLGGKRKSSRPHDRLLYDVALRERMEGYRLAMENHGLTPAIAHASEPNAGAYVETLNHLLADGLDATAILTPAADAIITALAKAGRHDIEVAGWANGPENLDPKDVLTGPLVAVTVFDFAKLGTQAMKVLTHAIRQPGADAERVLLRAPVLTKPLETTP